MSEFEVPVPSVMDAYDDLRRRRREGRFASPVDRDKAAALTGAVNGEDFPVPCTHGNTGICRKCGNSGSPALDLPDGWTADGPCFKDKDSYLSADGANPEAPLPGYGWPLGTECWYYVLRGRGLRLHVTGLTAESAARRAEQASRSDDPARFTGAVR